MKKAFFRLIITDDDIGVFVARMALGIVFIPHGLQKLLGLFGGAGFSGTIAWFGSVEVPAVLAFFIIIAESLGSIALFFGFIGRFMALGLGMVMTGAVFLAHIHNGFFMIWFGTQKGEGFEYHILAIGLALLILIKGSGRFSLDRLMYKLFFK
jgi:putative oxidoreductase